MDLESFYKSPAWRRKREAVLKRDGYMCRMCLRYGRRVPAVTVHHIVHLDDDPTLGLKDSNLISLCGACHNKLHPEKGGKKF